MSSMLIFEAYVYDFLLLIGKVDLLLFNFARSGGGFDLGSLGTTGEFLIKYKDMHWWNILLSSSTLKWF